MDGRAMQYRTGSTKVYFILYYMFLHNFGGRPTYLPVSIMAATLII